MAARRYRARRRGAALAAAAAGGGDTGEFALAFAVEAAMSVDPVDAVVLVFGYFAVPAEGRARLAGWVLAIAAALRLAAIPAGGTALDRPGGLVYPLAALLLATTRAVIRSGPDNPALEPSLAAVCMAAVVAALARPRSRRVPSSTTAAPTPTRSAT